MSTADYALFVSLFSATISMGGLVWNVWSKWIYPKGRLRVTVAEMVLMVKGFGDEERPEYIVVNMTNYGPSELTVKIVGVEISNGHFKKASQAIVNPIHGQVGVNEYGIGPIAGGLPKTLKVGEQFALYFPHSPKTFMRAKLKSLGVHDNFGTYHQVPKKLIHQVKRSLDAKYNSEPYVTPD